MYVYFSFVNDVASVRMGTRLPLHMVKRYTPMHEHNMWSCLKVEGKSTLRKLAHAIKMIFFSAVKN